MTNADDALAVCADPLLQHEQGTRGVSKAPAREQGTRGVSNRREGPNGYCAISRLR